MKKLSLLLLILMILLTSPRAVYSQEDQEDPVYYAYLPAVFGPPPIIYLPMVMRAEPEPEPPVYMFTNSYYITTISPANNRNKMYNLGCDLGTRDKITPGKQDSVVLLDFGSPTYKDGYYGANMVIYTHMTIPDISNAVKSYGKGYYDCTATDTVSQLVVGIGTTNFDVGPDRFGSMTPEHGQAWAQMVNDVNAHFIAEGYSGQVLAYGANDMELYWNSPADTYAWIQGYNSVNLYPLIDFGDASGCPTRLDETLKCYNGWSEENVWYKAYGAPSNYPLPEIYFRGGLHARQWAYLSYWAYQNKGERVDFLGTLTQWTACQQAGEDECHSPTNPNFDTDNTPFEGYDQLYDELLIWPGITSQSLRWSSDMMWK